MKRILNAALLALLLALIAPAAVLAQGAYPSKAIKLIVPFPAGGTTDILARSIANELTRSFGHPVVVENRAGAGGNIGADAVAKSAPDGYTLLMGTVGTHGINSGLYAKMPYDAVKDFAPITIVAAVPNMLVVHPSLPVKTVKDLIDLAKANPGKITFASSGAGTSIHLSAELFKTMAGVNMLHIPYKGSAPALTDLAGGQVNIMFDNMPSALPLVKGGRLRAIAVTTLKRSPAMPDLPTIAESGLPGYDASSWFAVLAPAGTPRDIVMKLNAAIVKSLGTPEMKEKLSSQGAEPVGNTPEQFAAHIQSELVKWAKVIKESGAKVE
jgi:tripartite-type tricarboxylate transporter receptor subunit TctC